MLTILAVGKLKEPFYKAAAAEYEKRLGAFGGIRISEFSEAHLPSNPSPKEIAAALHKEADTVLAAIPQGSWVCALTPEGRELSSESFAEKLQTVRLAGKSSLVFILGSSYGMDDSIRQRADFRLSLSPMTFPHHLARVVLLEQLYRAETILAGMTYHK